MHRLNRSLTLSFVLEYFLFTATFRAVTYSQFEEDRLVKVLLNRRFEGFIGPRPRKRTVGLQPIAN